jgi:hypothetical protein
VSLFGESGVRSATNIVVTQVANLIDSATKFGGVPQFVQPINWPRCASCKDFMMFIGQLEMGADKSIKHPTPSILYMFLCQSNPTETPECETWAWASGCSSVFMQALQPAHHESSTREQLCNQPSIDLSRVEALVSGSCAEPLKTATLWTQINEQGNKTYRAPMFGQYRCSFIEGLSVNEGIQRRVDSKARYSAIAELAKHRVAFINGFPSWVQDPIAPTCKCGKTMEFVLQFTSFDEAINLGDSGEAYVFSCPDYCSPISFALAWQCC